MATTRVETIMPGVIMRTGARGKSIRFACMVKGTRFQEPFTKLPAALCLDARGRPTRALKDAYAAWKAACEERVGVGDKYGLREPTVSELVENWERWAWERHRDPRYQQPSENTIRNALNSFKQLCTVAGIRGDENYRRLLNTDTLSDAFGKMVAGGLTGVTAWTYVSCVQTLTSRWTEPYWLKFGFLVKQPKMPDPGKAKDPPRYIRPSQELMTLQDKFYASRLDLRDKRAYLLISCMFFGAMRPIDVGHLTAENFFEKDGNWFCHYTPIKTKNTSGRQVTWALPQALWEQFREFAGERLDAGDHLVPHWVALCKALNPTMREYCGMPPETFSKAIYAYRSRCIDHVYHTKGLAEAVSISGDRADTIEYFYFDPAMQVVTPSMPVDVPTMSRKAV